MIVLRGRFEFYVTPYGRHWNAPSVTAALAGVIHDGQGTDNREHRSEDNCDGGLHCDLPDASLPSSFYGSNEPTLNAPDEAARFFIFRQVPDFGMFRSPETAGETFAT
jgi:hypothetical protein